VEDSGVARLELSASYGPALERNEEAIRHWKKVTWPDIKKKAQKEPANDRLSRREWT